MVVADVGCLSAVLAHSQWCARHAPPPTYEPLAQKASVLSLPASLPCNACLMKVLSLPASLPCRWPLDFLLPSPSLGPHHHPHPPPPRLQVVAPPLVRCSSPVV